MIKINLATRKQAVSAAEEKSTTGGLGDLAKVDLKEAKGPIIRVVLLIVVIVGANMLWDEYQATELAKLDQVLQQQSQEKAKLNAEIAKTVGYKQIQQQLENDEFQIRTKIETIQKLIAGRMDPPRILRAVADTIPTEVWLEEFEIKGKEARFVGGSVGFEQISDFMKTLNESVYFTNVVLDSTTKDQKNSVDIAKFSLKAERR